MDNPNNYTAQQVDEWVTQLLTRLPKQLRPRPANIRNASLQAANNGWLPDELAAAVITQSHPTSGAGAACNLIRELAQTRPVPTVPKALATEAHRPPTKWSWCPGCQDPWDWVADPARGHANLCNHHRHLAQTIETTGVTHTAAAAATYEQEQLQWAAH